jgi:hydrogenase-4 component B
VERSGDRIILLLLSVGILVCSGFVALLGHRSAGFATIVGVGGAVVGCAAGLIPALGVLLGGAIQSLHLAWSVPYGSFFVKIDALSAFFVALTLGLSSLAAIYGGEYLWAFRTKKSLGGPWFFFNVLVASMVMVVLARNGILLLVAWEVMALSSFFLVTFEDERKSVREAGWTYLVATHLGTAFLLAMFVLMGRQAGSLDFDQFGKLIGTPNAFRGLVFLLAVIGFGTKAGFMPLHVWLPEAHPAAPSHVSALMSGVMIKMGIYGLVRMLTFLGPPPAWWGWLLIGIGLSSGILGVLFALAQHDLKKLLAYHSIENIGIIALGLGVGLLGMSNGSLALIVLGFGGGLLHVANHALFKSLLFLGAGAVSHGTGTREIDRLGGLLKRMPWTGATFLVGAVAISGLPPLNGFVSELLIYLGAFGGGISLKAEGAVPLFGLIAGLALIGGLAAACFAKAFGIVFLGQPRSKHGEHAHESGWAMRIPMLVLAVGCVLIGLLAPMVLSILQPLVHQVSGLPLDAVRENLGSAAGPLRLVATVGAALLVLIAILALLRWSLLANRKVEESVTWGCGYAQPTARMQYTASSFAQPLTDLFRPLLGTKKIVSTPSGYFPSDAALKTETLDVSTEKIYRPVFAGIESGLSRLRWLQQGNVQLYVLYIALTLLVLLVWEFW